MQETPTTETGTTDIFDNDLETQKEMYAMYTKKTRNKLLTVAAVVFFFDLLALLVADFVTAETLGYILIIPAIVTGMAFLSLKEPMLGVIITAVIIVGIWIYMIVTTDATMAVRGWLAKAIIITLLLAGFQSAKEAQRIKKEFGL